MTNSYPWYTPYQFAGNTPIQAIDLDGLEILDYRTMFTARITKTATSISYSLDIVSNTNTATADFAKAKQTEQKLKSVLGAQDYAIAEQNRQSGARYTAANQTNGAPSIPPTKQAQVYDPDQKSVDERMNKATEMEDNPTFEYTGNAAPAKLNAGAFNESMLSYMLFAF